MSGEATLLLVEDQVLLLIELEQMLREAGFAVITAKSGLRALQEIQSDPSRFRALVTDVDLGPGPRGWDLARHIREAVPSMPVVYVSGLSPERWAAQGVPGSIMVPKPCSVGQVITALRTLMSTAEVPSASPRWSCDLAGQKVKQ